MIGMKRNGRYIVWLKIPDNGLNITVWYDWPGIPLISASVTTLALAAPARVSALLSPDPSYAAPKPSAKPLYATFWCNFMDHLVGPILQINVFQYLSFCYSSHS